MGGDDIITQRKSSQFVISPNLVNDVSQGREEGGTCSVHRKETCKIDTTRKLSTGERIWKTQKCVCVCVCVCARARACVHVCMCIRVILHNIHTKILLSSLCFSTVCFNVPCQFTPLLNLRLISVQQSLAGLFAWIEASLTYGNTIFLFTPTFSGTQLGRDTRTWCILKKNRIKGVDIMQLVQDTARQAGFCEHGAEPLCSIQLVSCETDTFSVMVISKLMHS